MKTSFGIRRYFRADRTFLTGLLGYFLILSVSGPNTLLGLSYEASNCAPTSKSDSKEGDANELMRLPAAEIWVSGK